MAKITNFFRTTQKDARGRDIFKDRDSGTYFTIDPKTGAKIAGGKDPNHGQAPRPQQDTSYIDDQYSQVPSAEEAARRMQEEYERRLQQHVDPVLRDQQNVINQLKSRESLEDYYGQLRGQFGVDTQEQGIRGLEQQGYSLANLLNQLPGRINEQTAGTLTTEAQRRAIEQEQRAPMTAQLQELSTLLGQSRSGYSDALANIERALGLRTTQEARLLEPIERSLQFSGINLDRNREDLRQSLLNNLSGFSTDLNTTLSRIQANIGEKQTEAQRQDAYTKALFDKLLDQTTTGGQELSTSDQSRLADTVSTMFKAGRTTDQVKQAIKATNPSLSDSQIDALILMATQGSGGSTGSGRRSSGGSTSSGNKSTPRGDIPFGEYVNARGSYPDAFLKFLVQEGAAAGQSLNPSAYYQDWLNRNNKTGASPSPTPSSVPFQLR